jgi:hypothetical protein
MAIATLDEISGQRAILGIGAGISGFTGLGINLRKPARAIREMIEVIPALLRGESAEFHGEVIEFHQGRLSFVPTRSAVPIYVASNGPLGQRVAGAVADDAVMEACALVYPLIANKELIYILCFGLPRVPWSKSHNMIFCEAAPSWGEVVFCR